MRRKIHITEHGFQDTPPTAPPGMAREPADIAPVAEGSSEPIATGDPATDPTGEQMVAGDPETIDAPADVRHGRHDSHHRSTEADAQVGDDGGLIARVAELEARVAEEHDKYLRAMAEFQNFRRRMEEENRRYAQFANEELVRSLLPVLDNFERALLAADTNKSFESLVGGVALTHRQLLDLLKKNGVEPIETKGQSFDPNFHEAVERVADSGQPENSIVQELQRGYVMNSRVIRPSIVRVSGG